MTNLTTVPVTDANPLINTNPMDTVHAVKAVLHVLESLTNLPDTYEYIEAELFGQALIFMVAIKALDSINLEGKADE